MDHKIYYQALSRFEKIGPVQIRNLLSRLNSIQRIWSSSKQELQQSGIDENVADEFVSWRSSQNLEQQWESILQNNIKVITIQDKEYPQLLKQIYDPPHTLFVRGNLPENNFNISVTGTRQASQYGIRTAEQIVRPLARSGVNIVSGLAVGIDTIAHHTAIQEQGTTIAVLGGGCDNNSIYPISNQRLAENIVESGGALISEYAPGTLSMPHYFPKRNRIISGLSPGVLIIEASEKSAALMIANHALDQNREVFAVPGDITRYSSKGTNNLLRMGAHPVLQAKDIFDIQSIKEITPDNELEEEIINHINNQSMSMDQLTEKTGIDNRKLSSILTLMEMKSKVRHIGAMNYEISNR